MTDRTYSHEEVDAILSRAIEQQRGGGSLSHDELVAAAREVGVPPEAISLAAKEVLDARRSDAELRTLKRQAWLGFARGLLPFVVICGAIIWWSGGSRWSIYMAVFWGFGILMHLVSIVTQDQDKLRNKAHKRQLRFERRQSRRLGRMQVEKSSQPSSPALQHQDAEVQGHQLPDKRVL